jgi:hypothetical protein
MITWRSSSWIDGGGVSVVQINTDPTRRQLNQFGFIWMGFVAFFGAIAFFKFHNPSLARGLWVAAVVVPIVGWIFPRFMRWIFLGMSYLAFPIGFVVSHVVLAVVYYLVLTPIGLLTRLFGYDSMKRRFGPEAKSYWVERPASAVEAKRYFRQF